MQVGVILFDACRVPSVLFLTSLSLTDCLVHIVRQEGVSALWSGTKSSLMLVSNPAIQFMVYEVLKRNLQLLFSSTVSAFLLSTRPNQKMVAFIVRDVINVK